MRVRDEHKQSCLIETAMQMIVREGFAGFSMQKLAKEAGVSPATSYIYFKDKEDLLLHVFAIENKKMMEATLINFDPHTSFREGLKVQWINRAKYCLKHPESMHFLELMRNSPLGKKSMQTIDEKFRTAMHHFVTNAINRKELVKVPIEVYWCLAFAPLYSLVHFHWSGQSIGGRPFTFSKKIMFATLELVLKALKP